MSFGFDVSETMRSIRIILEKHTKNMDWNELLPDEKQKDRTFRRITDPEIIIAIDKAIKEPGAQNQLVAEKYGVSRTTVSNVRRRGAQYKGMPETEAGIRNWLKAKDKKYRERGKV
jgi:transposase-like protein